MPDPDSTTPLERVDLALEDDPRDVVHRAVACLVQGGLVALPTEVGYAVAACALQPGSVARLVQPAGQTVADPGAPPLHLAVKGADELFDWLPDADPIAHRLMRRSWPGPVALVGRVPVEGGLWGKLPEPVRQAVARGDQIIVRCPDHPLVADILHLIPGPLVLVEQMPGEDAPPAVPDLLADRHAADMILDDGPCLDRRGLTSLECVASSWRLTRVGAVDEAEMLERAAFNILFVCTGNTCRSPMAEAICRDLLTRALACPIHELAARGFVVRSAGISAHDGMPAAGEAVEVIRDRGGSLRRHASRRVTARLIDDADLIVTMTRGHRQALLTHFPEAADRVRVLDPQGGDIEDPIGADFDTYRHTAEQIEAHLAELIRELPA